MIASPCRARALLAGLFAGLLAFLLAALLCACGGSSSGGGAPAPTAGSGALSISVAGSAHPGITHAWVTVSAVALHADAERAWSARDTTWQVFTLTRPATIDIASLTNGVIASILTGKSLLPARYAQLRLFTLGHDEPLAASAKDLTLLYNAQVDYTDGAGLAHSLPLEMPDTSLGLRADTSINVTAGALASITLQWDLERSLARFSADDGVDRFTLRPDLRVLDLANTGAIVGMMDKSLLCAAGAHNGCMEDIVASAQMPSADGLANVSVRSTPVVVGDTYALFALYPLPVSPSGKFDVVIRGRNMQTMVVRQVPASAADLLAAAPTQLGANPNDPTQPAPMIPVLSAQGDAQARLAQALTPSSAQLVFGQTLPGTNELPYEVATANTDPFTGLLARPVALPSGPLRVATYSADTVLSFANVTPQEGLDGFSLSERGTRYDDVGASSVMAAPGGSSVAVVAAHPSRKSNLGSATLTVGLSGGSVQSFDAAELVVTDVAGIVLTQDVSALIGQSGAQVSLPLPAGANAAALGGTAVYAVAVRAWRRASPAQSLQWARAPSPVDLRNASSASVAITLP